MLDQNPAEFLTEADLVDVAREITFQKSLSRLRNPTVVILMLDEGQLLATDAATAGQMKRSGQAFEVCRPRFPSEELERDDFAERWFPTFIRQAEEAWWNARANAA